MTSTSAGELCCIKERSSVPLKICRQEMGVEFLLLVKYKKHWVAEKDDGAWQFSATESVSMIIRGFTVSSGRVAKNKHLLSYKCKCFNYLKIKSNNRKCSEGFFFFLIIMFVAHDNFFSHTHKLRTPLLFCTNIVV